MSEHTPGPWTAEQWKEPQDCSGHGWSIRPHRMRDGGITGFQLAAIEGDDSIGSGISTIGGSAEANARLIAAAPDLLEACRAGIAYFCATCEHAPGPCKPMGPAPRMDRCCYAEFANKFCVAIAKAEGK